MGLSDVDSYIKWKYCFSVCYWSTVWVSINFTDEIRNVSVTLMCRWRKWAWLAGRGRCTENRPELETVHNSSFDSQ